MNRLDFALQLIENGISVIPTKLETKQSFFKWKKYQSELPSTEDIMQWFTDDNRQLAIITGKLSKVEIVDFDNHDGNAEERFKDFKELVINTGIFTTETFSKLYIEKSQSGGFHIAYRCAKPGKNQKLAMNQQGDDVWIETRGEGGYCLVNPSDNYTTLQGDLLKLPTIINDQRDMLINVAKSFNRYHTNVKEYKTSNTIVDNEKPGNDFNGRGDVTDDLIYAGWKEVFTNNKGNVFFTRPGKDQGISAVYYRDVPQPFFYNFSTSVADFNTNTIYKNFAVRAILKNNGDFSACAKALALEGYGNVNGNVAIKTNLPIIKTFDDLLKNTDFDKIYRYLQEDELGEAELYSDIFKSLYCYVNTHKKWFKYKNGHWVADDTNKFRIEAIQKIKELYNKKVNELHKLKKDIIKTSGLDEQIKELDNCIKEFNTRIKRLNKKSRIDNLADLASTLLAKSISEFDTDSNLLNLQNGTYNLETKDFKEHNSNDFLTKIANADYIVKPIETPVWNKFIDETFKGDESLIEFTQMFLGSCLSGRNVQSIYFAYGIGANGKSTLFNILTEVLNGGDNASHDKYVVKLNNRAIAQKSSDSNNFDLPALKGARLAILSELPNNFRMDESVVKDITGGDDISARVPHGKPFIFTPEAKIVMVGNHKPIIRDSSDGIWRRLRIVPFKNVVSPEKIDTELESKIKQEKNGILQWLIEGFDKFKANNYQIEIPDIIKNEIQEYREDQDIIESFLSWLRLEKEFVVEKDNPDVKILQKELFNIFKDEFIEKEHEGNNWINTSRKMGKILRNKGFILKKSNQSKNYVFGISSVGDFRIKEQQQKFNIESNITNKNNYSTNLDFGEDEPPF